jgi:hypothetical protein
MMRKFYWQIIWRWLTVFTIMFAGLLLAAGEAIRLWRKRHPKRRPYTSA